MDLTQPVFSKKYNSHDNLEQRLPTFYYLFFIFPSTKLFRLDLPSQSEQTLNQPSEIDLTVMLTIRAGNSDLRQYKGRSNVCWYAGSIVLSRHAAGILHS